MAMPEEAQNNLVKVFLAGGAVLVAVVAGSTLLGENIPDTSSSEPAIESTSVEDPGIYTDVDHDDTAILDSIVEELANTPASKSSGQESAKLKTIPVTLSRPSANCSSNIYNCTDFSSCAEVVSVFSDCPYDVHGLDGDDDGVPCESLCR